MMVPFFLTLLSSFVFSRSDTVEKSTTTAPMWILEMVILGVQPKRIVMITMRDMGIGDTVIVTVLNRIEIKST